MTSLNDTKWYHCGAVKKHFKIFKKETTATVTKYLHKNEIDMRITQ